MSHAFVAYIDEAGDEGFGNFRAPGQGGGQSHWFVLSALVVRQEYDSSIVGWRDEIRTIVTPNRARRDLHFIDLDHSQRKAACQKLADNPFHAVSIICDKRLMEESVPQLLKKNFLYFMLAAKLIEQLSWICRDSNIPPCDSIQGPSGRVKLIFSRQGSKPYEHFKAILNVVKQNSLLPIYWPTIDDQNIIARDHSTMAGLQLADIVASAVFRLVEMDRFGNVESSYVKALLRDRSEVPSRHTIGAMFVDKQAWSPEQKAVLSVLL